MACKILSVDGGGTRGIVPATIINCIEQDTGEKIINLFDVFAGTSTGGIIVAALAAGLDSAKLIDLYLNRATEIFRQSFLDKISGVDEYIEADYTNKRLKKILENLLGNTTMKNLFDKASFGGKGKHVMVCSFDLNPDAMTDGNKNYRPDIFYSGYMKDKTQTLVDVCMMTSAAPTYFPIYNNHIDGGVAMNNPSMAAVAFAMNDHVSETKTDYLYPDGKKKGLENTSKNIRLLSLGTGTSNKTFIDEKQTERGNWGKLKWVNYLPDLLTESNIQSTHYYVQQVLPEKNYIRCNPCFDVAGAPEILRTQSIKMDETDKQKLQAMHDFAVSYYQEKKADIMKLLKV